MRNIFITVAVTLLTQTALAAVDPVAYVVNSYGGTMSKINLNTGAIETNMLTLGSDVDCAPNQVVVRDTVAYVVNSLCDEIQVIDLKTETTQRFIQLPPGSNPYWMAFYDDNYLYVTLLQNNSLAKIDVATGAVLREDSVGHSPGGIVIANHKAYVGITALDDQFHYGQGQVAIYDCRGDSLIQQINVGTNPNNLAVDSAGRVHIVCSGDYTAPYGFVYVFDPTTDTTLDSLYLGGTGYDTPGAISIGPDNVAYVAAGGWSSNGRLYAYDAQTLEVFNDVSNPITVRTGCMSVAAYQDTSCIVSSFYDWVDVLDTSGAVVHSYPVGVGPVHVAFNYLPGDINGDFSVDGVDLSYMLDMLFISLREPTYMKWRANLNNDFSIDGIDLAYLLSTLFIEINAPLSVGPTWLR